MRTPLSAIPAKVVRLWSIQPDMTKVAAGFSSLAVGVALVAAAPKQSDYPNLFQGVVASSAVFVLLGAILLFFGVVRPAVDVEEPWNAAYDTLRSATAKFVDDVATSTYNGVRYKYREAPADWKECAKAVRLPHVKVDKPLHLWCDFLATHQDLRIQLFFEFARACENLAGGADFRRLATRIYHTFYRSRFTKRGFAAWMDAEEVRAGAEEIVVLLAYMAIARACTVKTGRTPGHLGFWNLAEEWHADLLHLPRDQSPALEGGSQRTAP